MRAARRGWMPAATTAALIASVIATVSGAHAQVYRGNDTGGIIPWSCENEAVAPVTAAAFCASWGKYPRITSVVRMPGNYIAFHCLWRPDIARFQLPAVRTRASCHLPRYHPHVRVRY